MKKKPLKDPTVCPHLTLDMRDAARPVCRQCGTPWPLVHAAGQSTEPTLFGGAA